MSSEFIDALRALGRKRITLEELRRCWLALYPELLQHPERDALLLIALEQRASAGDIVLPAPASYERRGNPCMPKFVTLKSEVTPAARENWASIAWVPQLGFWTTLTQSELQTARAINAWLIRRGGRFLQVPLRERSLDIFDDEKYLDTRVRGNALFAGRLPLSAIGAFTVAHPLPHRIAQAPGCPLLVVENHHTYWSFSQWNLEARRYAAVAYGSGQALGNGSAAVEETLRQCGASSALYFGDLDPRGILIPMRFTLATGLSLEPAVDFYRMSLEIGIGVRRRDLIRVPGDTEAALQWIPQCAQGLAALWSSGWRIPQESIGTEQLFRERLA